MAGTEFKQLDQYRKDNATTEFGRHCYKTKQQVVWYKGTVSFALRSPKLPLAFGVFDPYHRATRPCLSPLPVPQLWQCGVQYAAEVVLEGLARAGARGRCTPMGRSAMSLDLQGLQRGLQGTAPAKQDSVINALRIVDAYIKAYYIPWGPELHRWAMSHPEYTQASFAVVQPCRYMRGMSMYFA